MSRNPDEVDAYVADPASYFGVDSEGMRQMLSVAGELSDPRRLAGVRGDLPIDLFSGDADPIAGGGPVVEMHADRYRAAGVEDVTVELYPEAPRDPQRANRDEVIANLAAWHDPVTAG